MTADIDPNKTADLKQLVYAINEAINGEDEDAPIRYVFALMMFPLGNIKETNTRIVSNYAIRDDVISNMIHVLQEMLKNPNTRYRGDA